jgi:hypothetical protein
MVTPEIGSTLAIWGEYSVWTSEIEVGVVGNGRTVLSQARLATRLFSELICLVVEQLRSLCRELHLDSAAAA